MHHIQWQCYVDIYFRIESFHTTFSTSTNNEHVLSLIYMSRRANCLASTLLVLKVSHVWYSLKLFMTFWLCTLEIYRKVVLVEIATHLQYNEFCGVYNLAMIISYSSILLHILLSAFVSGTKLIFFLYLILGFWK